jgi:hypothetical protein
MALCQAVVKHQPIMARSAAGRALLRRAVSAINAVRAVGEEAPRQFSLKMAPLTEAMKSIAEETEMDMDVERIVPRSAGRLLGRQRLKRDREAKSKGCLVGVRDLAKWAESHGLPFPDELARLLTSRLPNPTPLDLNGIEGTNGTTAVDDLLQDEL